MYHRSSTASAFRLRRSELRSLLHEAEVRASEHGLRRFQPLLFLSAGFLDSRILRNKEVTSFVEVIDLVLQHLELPFFRTLRLLQLLELRRLLGLFALLRNHELRVISALGGRIIHRLLIILLSFLLVALRLSHLVFHILDHLVDHVDDARTGFALLVLAEGLRGSAWIGSGDGNLREKIFFSHWLWFLVKGRVIEFVQTILSHAEEIHRGLVRRGLVDVVRVLILPL